MSYTSKAIGALSIEYRLLLTAEAPKPAEGYEILQIANLGDLGLLFIEYKFIFKQT